MLSQQVDGVGIHESERQPHVKHGSRLIGDAGFFNALTDHLVSEDDIPARSSQGRVVVKIISAEFLPQLTEGPCDVFARYDCAQVVHGLLAGFSDHCAHCIQTPIRK